MIVGNLILGIGIGIGVYINLGTDPGTTFFLGVSKVFNLGFGNAAAIANCFLFIPMIIFKRSTINLGTFVNMFGIGYTVEITSSFLASSLPELSLLLRLICLLIAVFLVCFGAALYLNCNIGQAPWDAIATIIITYVPKWKYSNVRMIQDLSGLFLGFLMGASIGIASIIFAFFIGPGIGFFSNKFQKANLIFQSQ